MSICYRGFYIFSYKIITDEWIDEEKDLYMSYMSKKS